MAKDEDDLEDKKPEEAAGGGKKKPPMKLIIIAAVGGVLLLGGVGAALFFTGVLGGEKKALTEEEAAAEEAAADSHGGDKAGDDGHEGGEGKKDGTDVVIVPLGDMIVNLASEGNRMFFLKLRVDLQLFDKADGKIIEAVRPRIIDNFQVYMRELRVEDLRGSAGLYRLREELLMRVTEAAHPARIKDILFQEMLISGQ